VGLRRVATFDHADGSRSVFATIAGERLIVVSPHIRSPVANVLLIHGLGDYSARHIMNGRFLAGRGYRTVILELGGHGGHSGPWVRTMPMYELYARHERSADVLRLVRAGAGLSAKACDAAIARQYERFERTSVSEHLIQIATVLRHLHQITKDRDALPLMFVGHSLGALLAHETVCRMKARDRVGIAGLVLIAPAFRPQGDPERPLMRLAVNTLWELRRAPGAPIRTAAKSILNLNFGLDTTWSRKWLTDISVERKLFAADPLMPHWLPTRYANSIESLMASSARRTPRLPYDSLVLVPRRDGLTSRKAAVRFAERANAAGKPRTALLGFEVVAHDILRSSARKAALTTIADWMDGQVQSMTARKHRRARRR
jgi:alpha-beta hydrolase superfamily lysophospholipase